MAAIHTNVPAANLPTELATPNIITSEYESYTLIPKMGPLSYSYYKKKAKFFLYDYVQVIGVLVEVKDFEKDWYEQPLIPAEILHLPEWVQNADIEEGFNIDDLVNKVGQPARNVMTTNVTPRTNRSRLRNYSEKALGSLSKVLSKETQSKDLDHKTLMKKQEQFKGILTQLNKPNSLINSLADDGLMFTAQGLVNEKLNKMDSSEQFAYIVDYSTKKKAGPGTSSKLHQHLADQLIGQLIEEESKLAPIKEYLDNRVGLKDKLAESIADRLKNDQTLETIESVEDPVITKSREWAFLRRERVELALQTPKLRGPLSVNSVSPDSELALTQSKTSSQITGSQSLQQAFSSLTGATTLSSQVKSNMGTLFDYGSNLGQTMSEEGYARDNSRGEKRSIVESTLSELSQSNAAQTISSQSSSTAQIREYRTEGKDEKYATTEVSFEVFSPVKVTHYLDGIGAVWCPRIKNPYLHLNDVLDDYEQKIKAQYIQENFVADPAEPLATYDGIARVSVNTDKTIDSDIEDGECYEEEVIIELSDEDKMSGYMLDRNIECSFKQDDDWWTDAIDSDQYRIFEPVIIEHIPNSHIRIKTEFKILDESWINPHSIWLNVSVSKFKYTQTYLEQMKEYRQTVDVLNPARKEAIKAQAEKYARLKRDELVKKYETNIKELKDYTFVALMKEMFTGNELSAGDWSYYHGVIKSCIDWERARIEPEPASPQSLVEDGLSPYHFLNVNAVRFFLPIHEGSEDAFFEAVGNATDDEWNELFDRVKTYINGQREVVGLMHERMSEEDARQLTLDQYDSELILGRHLESVLSNHPFSETENS